MDAAQQSSENSEKVETLPSVVNPPPPPAYPDAQAQLSSVHKETELIPKDVTGGDKSLLALLSGVPKMRQKIMELQKDSPELLLIDEVSFKKKHQDVITLVTQRIRVALWQEFEQAIHNNRVMRVSQIFAGTCSESSFYNLINNPVRLAYILCAPADYVVMLKEAHSAGLEKLREIFSARIMDDEGYLNPKAADMVIKAFALLDARLKGAVVQRIDQRNLHATVPTQAGTQGLGLPQDMEMLDAELTKARKQIADMTRLPRHPTTIELKEEMQDIVIDVVDMNINKDVGGNAKVLK